MATVEKITTESDDGGEDPTRIDRTKLPEEYRRINDVDGAWVDIRGKRIVITPEYPIKSQSPYRGLTGLKGPFHYGPLEWVPTGGMRGRPTFLPDGWKVEDWRVPRRHPAFPEMYVDRKPHHQTVEFHKARCPWDFEQYRDELLRKVEVPDGWQKIVKVPPEEHPLEELYRKRRRQDRMLNVIITARDSATGTGKTSLAVELAKRWDENGWSADKAALDPREYQQKYHEVDPGSVLILDEAEQAADNRRSMSDQNLTLSHLWATMRFKQVSSIITLPTVTMLDKRLKELADIRIHVVRRGWAKVYKVKVEDTGEHNVFEKQIAAQTWEGKDDDADYQALSEKKAERMDGYSAGDDEDEIEAKRAEIQREKRDELVAAMNEYDELTQKEIGEIVGLSRSAVSRIVNDE